MKLKPLRLPALFAGALLLAAPSAAQNTPGEVLSQQKVSSTEGTFAGPLLDGDQFGAAIAIIGERAGRSLVDLSGERQ